MNEFFSGPVKEFAVRMDHEFKRLAIALEESDALNRSLQADKAALERRLADKQLEVLELLKAMSNERD